MSDKKLYQQKMHAQLDEWRAEVGKLKAKTSGASADAQLKMSKQIKTLESKIEEGKTKLSQLAEAADDAWESIKGDVESTWDSLKSAVSDAAVKFKK
ncbi:MAG: hypothetical protein KBG75_02390 [Pseudomonadales bacterium]|nr:hypothetical protein [Pseudomonadales bacterium]